MAKSIIFVLGMHRSGTSLVTKALEVAGVDLGTALIPAAENNPKGFFEDKDCVNLNQAVLEKLHVRWDIPTLIAAQDFSDQALTPYLKDATYLLKTRLADADVFALKDPRLCLLAPFWIAAARSLGLEARFVVTVRHPLDVAHSLWRRNQFDYQKGLDLWLSHNYSLTSFLLEDQSKRIVISYENMLAQPDKELGRLTRFVGNNAESAHQRQEVADFTSNFVDPGLVHSHSDADRHEQSVALTGQIIELNQLLEGFANSRWSREKARKVIQAINPHALQAGFYHNQLKYFNQDIHQALGRQYHELENKFKQEHADLLSQLTEYLITAEQKQQYIDQLQAQNQQAIQQLEQQSSRIQAANTQLQARVQQLATTVEQKEQYIQELREQSSALLRERDTIVRRKQRELFYSEKRVASLTDENASLARQCSELDALRDQHEQLLRQLQEVLERVDALQSL